MTSTAGFRVAQTPCCVTFCLEVAYRSINYSAQEHWTDGEATNSLAPTDCGLRHCKCGSYYVLAEVEWGDRVDGDTYMGKVLARGSRVSDVALAPILAQNAPLSRLTEIAVRRRLWRHLNHDYRARYRVARQQDKNAIPEFQLSISQVENMEQLLSLLMQDLPNSALECTELNRELSRFGDAQKVLDSADADDLRSPVGKLLSVLIRDEIAALIRYRL